MNRRSTAAMSVHQRLEAASDLSALPNVNDDFVVACLRERFMADTIYTGIGSCGLVALNPHKYVPSNADSALQKYAAEYRDSSEHKDTTLPPHIFQLASNTYYLMRRTTQDQSMLFMCVPSVLVLVLSDMNMNFFFFFFITGANRAAVNPRTDGSPSRRSSNLVSPILEKKAPNSPLKFPRPNSSSSLSATHAPFSIQMPLGSENIRNCSSLNVGVFVVLKRLTIIWSAIVLLLFLPASEIFIFFTIWSLVRRQRRDSISIYWTRLCTGTLVSADLQV